MVEYMMQALAGITGGIVITVRAFEELSKSEAAVYV